VRKEQRSESIFRILFGSREKDPAGVIPEFIYTALPYIYVCAGLLTVVVLRNWIAAISALAWTLAAGIVWVRRYRYRSPFNRSGGRIDVPTVMDEDGPGKELVPILWQPSFECGHSIIDAQHRRLFGLGNKLVTAVLTNKLLGDIAWLLDELVDHITDHFCTEEAVLVKAKHPISKEHREVHRALLSKAADLRDRYRSRELVTGELVGFIVYDVITDHISKEAVEFSSSWSTRHSRKKHARRNSRRHVP
jgi:hemerythrin-like metal-binding protein